MANKGIELNTIVIIGAIAAGGYLIYKYIWPSLKGVSDVVSGATGAITTPIATSPLTGTSVSATDIAFPIVFIPKVVDEFKAAVVATKTTPTELVTSVLFPPAALLILANKALNPTKPELPQNKPTLSGFVKQAPPKLLTKPELVSAAPFLDRGKVNKQFLR